MWVGRQSSLPHLISAPLLAVLYSINAAISPLTASRFMGVRTTHAGPRPA